MPQIKDVCVQSHQSFESLCDIYFAVHQRTVRSCVPILSGKQNRVCVSMGGRCVHLCVSVSFVYTSLLVWEFLLFVLIPTHYVIMCTMLTRHDWGAECFDSTTTTTLQLQQWVAWGINEAVGFDPPCSYSMPHLQNHKDGYAWII